MSTQTKKSKPDIRVGMKVQQKHFVEDHKDGMFKPKYVVYDVLEVDDIYITMAPDNNHALDLRMTWDMARVRMESNMLTIIPDPTKIILPRARCKLVELTEDNKQSFDNIIGSLEGKLEVEKKHNNEEDESKWQITTTGYPIDEELRDRRR